MSISQIRQIKTLIKKRQTIAAKKTLRTYLRDAGEDYQSDRWKSYYNLLAWEAQNDA